MEFGFDWNAEKNRQLIAERGVSFDIVVSRMRRGGHVDTIEHPNKTDTPGSSSILWKSIIRYIWFLSSCSLTARVFSRRSSPAAKRRETI